MSSRQEEKERRRQERMEQERKEQVASARARRLQIAGGAVLVLAIAAVAVVLLAGSGGGGDKAQTSAVASAVKLPKAKITDLDAAAKAAGCKLIDSPSAGRNHVTTKVTYKTNPPNSGPHNPVPAEDGVYEAANTPEKEHFVHSLEHGRIELQYQPGAPKSTVDTLEAIFNEPLNGTPGYHTLVFQNNTKMPYAVAAVAWTHTLGCPTMNPQVIDAVRAFRTRYTDKAPEFIP